MNSKHLRRSGGQGLRALTVALIAAGPLLAQVAQPTSTIIAGSIDQIEIDDIADPWSGGMMVVAGQVVIVPRNFLIDLPANRLTLQQLFLDAPPDALALGKTGLATLDGLGRTGVASILGNRSPFGNVIAGEIFIEKGQETVAGIVTFIDHTAGYMRVDGVVGDPDLGVMVRINDPSGRHTIQQGLGCDGGPNCSADPRFGLDPDNYTITFSTGYPAGIPSTVPLSGRATVPAGMDPAAASDAAGVGDPLCPATNRGVNPVPDSTKFAPIQVGDHIVAEGNFETIGGAYFLSAHTLGVGAALTTLDDPSQPDYMTFDEVEWDVPAFANQRLRTLFIGFTTLPTSQLDLFALHVDPLTNENNEFIIGSTVNNPNTINQGIGATAGGIFKIRYDVDFLAGTDARTSPCVNLANAGVTPSPCPLGGTLAEDFSLLSPISREMIGRTRHKLALNPGVETLDINGNLATNGEYLTPVGIGHPEFVEINLDALATPLVFEGLPWNLDRRLSPGGCGDAPCPTEPMPLQPFPRSGLDLAPGVPAGTETQPVSFFPFGPADVLDPGFLAQAPGPLPITLTPVPGPTAQPTPPPVAGFQASVSAGVAPLTVDFTDTSTGVVNARLWDFGDGTYGLGTNPSHIYGTPGTYTVTLTALGLGGESTATQAGLVQVTDSPPPPAPLDVQFGAVPRRGTAPLDVRFRTRVIEGMPTSATLDFGDGTSSPVTIGTDLVHTYTAPGVYTVILTATDGTSVDVVIRSNFIRVD